MKSMTHIAPLFNALFQNKLFFNGFIAGRNLRIFNYCAKAIPELSWDINANFPFEPVCIPKIKDRKIRKACYQSFALYKKSFKSRPKAKLKIWIDEWTEEISKSAKKVYDDLSDAISYAFANISWDSLKQAVPSKIPDYAEFLGIRVAIDKGTK